MAALHIEEFYKDCARILLQLFASFPRRTTVFVEDISGPDQPDDCGVHGRRYLACFGAMIWLAEEGFLRYSTTIRQEAIDQATLTLEGLRLLSRVTPAPSAAEALPGSIERPGEPNVDLLRRLLDTSSSSRLADHLQRMLLGT